MNKNTLALVALLSVSFFLLILSIPLVMAVEDSWVTMESMPTARHSLGVAVVDGKIYAMGGYVNGRFSNLNEMYDPKTDTWYTKTPLPKPRSGFGIAVYQNKIFIFGGSGYISGSVPGFIETTDVYDPETDTWDTRASIPTPREDLCANVVDNKIYLIGGNVYVGATWPSLCNKNEVYDPETDTWDTKTPLPNYHGLTSAGLDSAVVDDKIYVISQTEIDSTIPFNQIYDPETDTWSSGTMMPTLASGFSVVATSGEFAPKRIHVLSGNTHQIYDPETDTWTNGAPMLTSRCSLGVAIVDDKLYAIGGKKGGETYPTEYYSKNEMYTPVGYIPEFPSWIVVPLFIIVAVVVIIYRKKLTKKIPR
jgi:N-acetylneuraminic acid mutarotase